MLVSPFSRKKTTTGSLFFNGVGDYLTSTTTGLLNNEIKGTGQKFTISIWFKRVVIDGTYQTIFSRDNNDVGGRQFACEFTPDEQWSFFIADSDTKYSWWKTQETFTNTNSWYHAVIVFDNTLALANKCVLYMNGQVANTTRTDLGGGVGTVNSLPNEPIYLCVTNFGGLINPFGGYLSRISFWNGAMSAGEALALYNNGCGVNEADFNTSATLVHHNEFGEAEFTDRYVVRNSADGSLAYTSTGLTKQDKVLGDFGGRNYNPNTIRVINSFTTAPTERRVEMIDSFITNCINDGNWALMDGVWMFAAHAQQAATVEWKYLSTITEVSSPAWAVDRGYTGDGAADYLNLNWNPTGNGANYTLNSASMGTYNRLNLNEATASIGTLSGTSGSLIVPRNGGTFAARLNSATNTTVALANSQGLVVVRRTASNAQAIFRNGSSLASSAAASNSLTDNPVFALAYNNAGSAALFSNNQISFAFVGGGGIDQSLLYKRVQAFMTSLGANV